jgi:SNW domain-containing protein 1
MAADGRGLQQIQINDNFAKLSESLFIAERNAREAVSHRNRIRETLARNKIQQKEDLLRQIAEQTREERTQALQAARSASTSPSRRSESPESSSPHERRHDEDEDQSPPEANEDRSLSAKEKRDMIRKERERERERDRRMEAMGKKTKAMRDAERDVSEKVALGQKAPPTRKETQYDSRLFSQSEGMDSGFGAEDDYTLYDKPLLRGSNANTLYRPKAGDSDVYGSTKDVDKLLDTKKFKPSRDFDGVDRSDSSHGRSGPVQFEKANHGHAAEEDDPFGLDEFISEAKSKSLEHIGQRGTLHAGASGGSATDGGEASGKRSRMHFERESDGDPAGRDAKRRRRDD